jgi:hypothetical protein
MPCHESGMPNRRVLSPKAVFQFRLERQNKLLKLKAVDKKSKKQVHKHQEEPQPESSGSGPSPSISLMPLREMTLEIGSAKGDSPVAEHAGSLPTLPSDEIPLAAAVPSTRITVRPFLKARFAALEVRIEEWRTEDARWKKLVECRLAASSI